MTTPNPLPATPETGDVVHLDVDEAGALALDALRQLELSEDEAARIARHLLDSQLRGDVTGLARVLLLAQTTPTAGDSGPPTTLHETATTALMDGGGRFGFVAAEDATALAVQKAREAGVGVVGVNNHSFTGSLSYYLQPAAEEGMVAIALSTLFAAPGNSRVAPYGGGTALISTNPLAIAVPSDDGPIIWDISTASMSGGQLMYHAEAGLELPEDVGLDADGRPTRDAKAAWAGSVRAWGGHRGSGLAVMLQLLGLLCDIDMYSGQFAFLVIVIDPDVFGSVATFKARASSFANAMRSAPPEQGFDKVRLPFDGSRERLARSLADGITLPRDIFDRLTALRAGKKLGPSIAGRADGKETTT